MINFATIVIGKMDTDEIRKHIEHYKSQDKKMFATTSLQTHSIVLLHILAGIDKTIPVYFINTGYHFPETMKFREEVSQRLNVEIKILNSTISKHLQKDNRGNLLFTVDPDHCCYLNKIIPVDNILMSMDVWINGVRASQSESRRALQMEEKAAHNTLRYHPLLRWTDKMIFDYIKEYNLPRHPLEEKGYISIGCEPCTRKAFGNDERESRWYGLNKTECGLNTDLIEK
jgi:phosphoadenosine phosphosulfate reductase